MRIPLSKTPGSATTAPVLCDDLNAMFGELYSGRTYVTDAPYSADPTAVLDSTAAFSAAAAGCQPATPYTGSTIAVGLAGTVYIPPGTYRLNSQVNTNGITITWVLADGALITPTSSYAFLNGRVLRAGKQDNQYTNGIFYNATGFSSRNNVPVDSPPAVMGFLTPSQISTYPTCDSVASYADNTGVSPLAIIAGAGTTYTTTAIAFTAALSATILGQMRVGMIVQTTNDPVTFYSGFVTAWSANSITVSGWFQQGNAGAGQTPPNAQGAWVSPVTKIFAYNGNVTLRSNLTGSAQQATGFEIGVLNNGAAPSGFIGTNPLVWGYDCVNLGTFACDTGFNVRHNTAGFFTGFQVSGINNAGPTVYGYFDQTTYGAAVTANAVGFLSAGATASAAAIGNNIHFQASNTTIGGGGSTIATQIGFLASALTGATNNRGFAGQVAAGANNYNLYMSGTAQNFLAGPLGINGAAPVAQLTGWGTPTGTGVIANFPGASATLPQCSQAIATIITNMKNFGTFGA